VWALGITAIEIAEEVPYADLSWLRVLRAIRNRVRLAARAAAGRRGHRVPQPPPTLTKPMWSEQFRDFVRTCLGEFVARSAARAVAEQVRVQ
jgi:hypothetical protein